MLFSAAIQIQNNECDTEQRLEDALEEAELEPQRVKAVGLLSRGQFLQEHLWILARQKLIRIAHNHWPILDNRDCECEAEPERGDEGAPPHGPAIPAHIATAAREFFAQPQ